MTNERESLFASTKRRVRITVTRDECYSLIEGLEAYFDSFAPNEDYLIEREIALHERLQTFARRQDEKGYRSW